jgi:hypothetical protein
VFGLFTRKSGPLALMVSTDKVPILTDGQLGVRHLDVTLGTERGHDGTDDERERKGRPGKFGDLPG